VLLDGAADVAFVHLPIDERGLELEPLYAEERVALLAADHPLAGQASISIAQLADDPVVLHRGATDAWEAFHNQNPRPDGHVAPQGPTVSNPEEKLELIAAGAAISFVPKSVAAAADHQPGVAIVQVSDIPPTQVCLASNSARHSPLIAGFADAGARGRLNLGGRADAQARAWLALELVERHLVPVVAHQFGVHGRATVLVGDQQRRAFGAGEVLVAPLAQRGEHRVETRALLGQVVLEALALARLLVVAPLEHPVLHQMVKTVAEHGLRHAHMGLHVAEAADTPHDLAQDQDDPGLPDELDGPPE
jgi:hypothetical protein